jgi:hypothetical protein
VLSPFGVRQIDLGNPVADHPLNRGLVSWWLPLPNTSGGSRLLDIVRGPGSRYTGTLTGGPTWEAGPTGFASINFDGSDDRVTTFDFTDPVVTVTGWFNTRSLSALQHIFGHRNTTRRSQLMIAATTGTVTFETSNTTPTVNSINSASTVTVDRWYWFCATVDYPNTFKALWLNGVEETSTTGISGALGAGGVAFALGSRSATLSGPFNGRITGARYYGRAFTGSEQYALYADELAGCPTTLRRYTPKTFSFGKPAAGGAVTTLTADVGTFTLSGQSAVLKRALAVVGGTGSYALSGQNATLDYDQRVVAETGSYALSGQTANLSKNYPLTAAVGAFVLSGQDATLDYDQKLAAAVGSFALSGQDATLAKSGTPGATDTGTFALSGQDASLLTSQKLTAAVGSFSLSGQDAALRQNYAVSAETGTFEVTGQTATLDNDQKLSAGTGTYAFTGRRAYLLAPGDSAAEQSNLTTLHAG